MLVLQHQVLRKKEKKGNEVEQIRQGTECRANLCGIYLIVTEDEPVARRVHCGLSMWKRVRLEYLGGLGNNANHKG